MTRQISPYMADDSDDQNETNAYWLNWERAEIMASMTMCDYQAHCFDCPVAFSDIEDSEITPCENATPLNLEFLYIDQYWHYLESFWVHIKEENRIELWYTPRF